MRYILLAALIALATVVSFPTPQPVQAAYVQVINDPGGNVGDYLRWYERLNASGIQVRVIGACISACTLVLSLPKSASCITVGARLGFHLASVNGLPDPDMTKQLGAAFYPPAVVKWIEEHGPLVQAPIYMTGEELINLGVMRECP